MQRIMTRPYSFKNAENLIKQGIHPVLARIYAARGIADIKELSTELSDLLPPSGLLNAQKAASFLADTISHKKKICIIADYDCDGATACAVAIHSLQVMGANVSFLVPNRFEDGYGLTPNLVHKARNEFQAEVLLTVDNGIASLDGVWEAYQQGMDVLITDHHLPGDQLPKNCIIVNPNHPDCTFGSKNLAGVGVIFYVMLMLRAELRKRGVFNEKNQPRLDGLLDLVALGTISDVVNLDKNNRILVAQGLKRIKSGNMQNGISALFQVAGREWRNASCFDLGFLIAPRLNAAGRLTDMNLGVECLITKENSRAWEIAQELNEINKERREIETGMREEAAQMLESFEPSESASISILDFNWHQGIIGILASRIKDRYYRPVFVFAPNQNGTLRGSGRSIPGFHLRDALDLLTKRYPNVISRFGGHAMAAGVTLYENAYETFCEAFESIAKEQLSKTHLERVIETDGAPDLSCYTLNFVQQLESQIWGHGFEHPIFSDYFRITNQRILKNSHLLLQLEKNGLRFSAIYFNHAEFLPENIHLAFRLTSNEYNGMTSIQLVVESAQEAKLN